ncbi:hypothetical protein [Micromonospora globbae]|uniref:hypothetical protein n=1 Tax=Micromonospora globbae TaxID=1894969 RepID=UPI00341728A8|nr:hypothetical protein OH732_02225 [Micromonospora globbae]
MDRFADACAADPELAAAILSDGDGALVKLFDLAEQGDAVAAADLTAILAEEVAAVERALRF